MTRVLPVAFLLSALSTSCVSAESKVAPVPELASAPEAPAAKSKSNVVVAETAKSGPKLEHPHKVKSGERFPVVVYAKKKQVLSLYVDGKQYAAQLPWSCKHKGAYVYSLILHKGGTRHIEVKVGDKVVESSAVEVK